MMTKAEATEILAQQSFVFRHAKDARPVNLILQSLCASFLIFILWLTVVAVREDSNNMPLILAGAILLILLIVLGMCGLFRSKAGWLDRINISKEGIQRINPQKGVIILTWAEIEAVRFSKFKRDLFIHSAGLAEPLEVNRNLQVWPLAAELIQAMTDRSSQI